jgi:hypothetical protein
VVIPHTAFFKVREILQRFEHRRAVTDLCHARIQAGLSRRFKVDKLVDQQTWNQRTGDAVIGVCPLLPAFYGVAVCGPEVGREGERASVQQVAIFQRFVILIVVSGQTQCAGLDPHIDVLGHQHHFTRRVLNAQCINHPQNLIVCFALRQTGGQGVVE